MTGTTSNFGWNYVNSGADAVSGPLNFAFVPAIDATLGQIMGNVTSLRAGSTSINSVANTVVTTHVTVPAMAGDLFVAVLTANTSSPQNANYSALNRTPTGFDILSFRTTSTDYSINWIYAGFAT